MAFELAKLNDKHLKFCKEYLIDLNGTKACIRAGYSEKTASQSASRLLSCVKIQEQIVIYKEELEKEIDFSAKRVLEELARIAFIDPIEILDENGNMKPLNDITENARRAIATVDLTGMAKATKEETMDMFENDKNIKYTQIKLQKIRFIDKTKALQLLGQYHTLFKDSVVIDDRRIEYTGDNPEEFIESELSEN